MSEQDAARALEMRMVSAMTSAMEQVVKAMQERVDQMARDAVNRNSQRFMDEMARTGNAACEAVQAITRIELVVARILKEHQECPHCGHKAA